MHKRLSRLILAAGIVGVLLMPGGGCAVNRTPHGWLVRSGCTLEFTRPFHCALHGPASGTCCVTDSDENHPVNEPSGEALSADSAEKMIGNSENSGWLRLLQRRGRLGICANCKQMMQIAPSAPPPTAGTEPVHPRFYPVPTQPVFTAREFPLATGNNQAVPGTQPDPGTPHPLPSSSPSTAPEEIPAPPAAAKSAEGDGPTFTTQKTEQSSDSQQESSQKESNWVFSKPPERKPDPVIEIPPPSAFGNYGTPRGTHASQSSTRR
jgi:hypothetical protein